MSISFADLRFFDREEDADIRYRKLPHWSQPGTLCFITFRAHDSLPRAVLQDWLMARSRWLQQHGIDAEQADWKEQLQRLPSVRLNEYHRLISDRWHDSLDECHGACVLRRADLAAIVANSLKHFQGERYLLTDFVIMPNHVHLLAAFADHQGMLAQCDSWKHFTAVAINRALGTKGRFWQQDGF